MTKSVSQKRRAKTQGLKAQPKPTQRVRGNEVAPYVQATAPQLAMGSMGNIVVRNREIVLPITGTATAGSIPAISLLASSNFGVSPFNGLWLNNIAANYDRYRFRKLKFLYQPVLPVTTSGAIAIYWDCDANDTAAANYATAAGNYRSSTGSIFEPTPLVIAKDQLDRLPWYLVRGSAVADPVGVASPGSVIVATSVVTSSNSALAGSTDIGYLWMDYEVEFSCPTKANT